MTSKNPAFRFLVLGAWELRAILRAVLDARRTWIIVPHVHRVASYTNAQNGGWGIRYRRPFRLREVLSIKFRSSVRVLVASIRLGIAREVVVPRYSEEGLLANLLHVLEIIRRVRPDARVHVDWTITGTESGFRYGDKGEDVWGRLFKTLGPPLPKTAHRAHARVDLAFWGTGKDHLTGKYLQKNREDYHSTILKWVEISNQKILEQVDEICGQRFHGRFCIGVHKRVANPMVSNLQRDGIVPPPASMIKIVESLIAASTSGGTSDYAIFLATDDADAVNLFKDAFGPKLIVRENVQRTTADKLEVHFGKWDHLSIADAEDVLIDTVLLSQCNVLVHASSSVSTVASIINPALILFRA